MVGQGLPSPQDGAPTSVPTCSDMVMDSPLLETLYSLRSPLLQEEIEEQTNTKPGSSPISSSIGEMLKEMIDCIFTGMPESHLKCYLQSL
jgi:hypothetical protein